MPRASMWTVGLALAACHCDSGTAPARVPVTSTPIGPPVSVVREHMGAHFEAVTALQAALAHGRLVDARAHAAWFATHHMRVPPDWQARVNDMRMAARSVERAGDIQAAAAHVGRLGRACGACHEAEGATPSFSFQPAPAEAPTLESQMARHQWAAARLWEGVVGPDAKSWNEGARVMVTARLDVAKLAHARPNVEVIELAERLATQAQRAITVSEPAKQATLYGEMLHTCASCHALVRPGAVAGSRP